MTWTRAEGDPVLLDDRRGNDDPAFGHGTFARSQFARAEARTAEVGLHARTWNGDVIEHLDGVELLLESDSCLAALDPYYPRRSRQVAFAKDEHGTFDGKLFAF